MMNFMYLQRMLNLQQPSQLVQNALHSCFLRPVNCSGSSGFFFHRNYQLLLSSQILEIQDSYVGPYRCYYRANSHAPRTQQQRNLAVWQTNITENFAVLSLYRLRLQRKKVDNILKGVSLYINIFPKLLIILLIQFIF